MKIVIHQIKTHIEQTLTKREIAKKIKLSEKDIYSFRISKRSLDAREGLYYSYSVIADIKPNQSVYRLKDVSLYKPSNFTIPKVNYPTHPIIIGFGPAGLFAALALAHAGCQPIVFEMGQSIDIREKDVETFLTTRQLNTLSNIQYGEGGAGTFSDGKLTCRIKDERIPWILQQFVDAGAKESILYDGYPHIGTDQLKVIIPRLRQHIIDLGGQVHFNSQLNDIKVENNQLKAIQINTEWISTSTCFLACGHSNHELYKQLLANGITIEQKDMAIGVRIEHPQSFINEARYHQYANSPLLENASYNLTANHNGVGIYTFCMCPGGYIMASNCDKNTIVTNGMSFSKRDGNFANAALLVQTSKTNYGSDHPLAGFDMVHALEKKAYEFAGNNYDAPGITLTDFMHDRVIHPVNSTYSFNVVPTDLNQLFGNDWVNHVKSALTQFDRKMPGYIQESAHMVAIESKSSCPIRLTRNPISKESLTCDGLYPIGEGAGYSGGIISSALDGLKSALTYIESLEN